MMNGEVFYTEHISIQLVLMSNHEALCVNLKTKYNFKTLF